MLIRNFNYKDFFLLKHDKNSLIEVNLNPDRYEWRLERE
jgi:hypothetical protein